MTEIELSNMSHAMAHANAFSIRQRVVPVPILYHEPTGTVPSQNWLEKSPLVDRLPRYSEEDFLHGYTNIFASKVRLHSSDIKNRNEHS